MPDYDVMICGAGLAGSTLARQLRREHGDGLSIVLIDKDTRPLPEATHKVGESTVEVGARYLGDILGLSDYFESNHYKKLGLRWFFGDPDGDFASRPEFGLTEFPPVDSYQIDRGRLENDLRGFNEEDGIDLLEGGVIRKMTIGEGDQPHEVLVSKDNTTSRLNGRWLIDATGRQQFLQKKLGLSQRLSDTVYNAAWFRVDGRLDISEMVPPENTSWHERVDDERYMSTNHLMGDGRWVWTIPLSTDITSVGIVASGDVHPFEEYNTREAALDWLQEHEPRFAEQLQGRELLDFRVMRDYTYGSEQLLSSDRWACAGEAGVFSDPFYSPGTDVLGFTNCAISHLIGLDRDGELSSRSVDWLNQFLLSYNQNLTHNVQAGYPFHGDDLVMGMKIIWDITAGWGTSGPLMFNQFYLDPKLASEIFRVTSVYSAVSSRMQSLFAEWAEQTSNAFTYDFIDYLSIPCVRQLRRRNLEGDKSDEELLEDHRKNVDTLQTLALAIFLVAIKDVHPDQWDRFRDVEWLDPKAISLDPNSWEADGLFESGEPAGDLQEIHRQLSDVLEATGQS